MCKRTNNWDKLKGIVMNCMCRKRQMSYLCNGMNERQKETLKTRVISVGFAILAFAVFKPFGLEGLGWTAYPHLLLILILGIGVCYLTEAVMKHIVRMPATLDKGVDYIIKRNLRFQMINTPLEALMVCTYLHFVMKGRGLESPLSWGGFLGALLLRCGTVLEIQVQEPLSCSGTRRIEPAEQRFDGIPSCERGQPP